MLKPARGITPACAGKRRTSGCMLRRTWDHPRIRGEKFLIVQGSIASPGSPPHTRGKDRRVRREPFVAGITPAYAGKRRKEAGISPRPWDHPRIRGEKFVCFPLYPPKVGSTPHTRGKVQGNPQLRGLLGITPAYAGKKCPRQNTGWHGWDHPRIRGEKPHCSVNASRERGSPPHTRGKD